MGIAAIMGDKALQDVPHCHNPAHPLPGGAAPIPHPALPVTFVEGVPSVLTGGQPAVVMGSKTTPCSLPGCIPAGPAMVLKGSMSVMIGGRSAARVGDLVDFTSCKAPIPSPVGKIVGPGKMTVQIGG